MFPRRLAARPLTNCARTGWLGSLPWRPSGGSATWKPPSRNVLTDNPYGYV
jgi:hypothetical protein